MTPERRFEALGRAPAQARERLADRILRSAAVEIVAGPEVATASVRLPVPGTGSTFVAGRVVLTTCRVLLDGTRGDAAVQGRELCGALAAAICDAEAERGGPLAEEVDDLVLAAEKARADGLRDEARAVALTRLDDDEASP
ncbi:MAG TPA: phosphonate C-P lyase system protein PhnG [Solirubrobacteraceae bacterium]|nr:phosphonate C-P lyase system protein PhnG [Solirubrobacteraceae bacterium]